MDIEQIEPTESEETYSSNAELIILRGLPGSGKSTWAKREVRWLRKSGRQAMVVSRDTVREEFFCDYFPGKEVERVITRLVNEAISAGLENNYVVLVDQPNTLMWSIYELVAIGQKRNARIRLADFSDIRLKVCEERQKSSPRAVSFDILKRMHRQLVRSKADLYYLFDEVNNSKRGRLKDMPRRVRIKPADTVDPDDPDQRPYAERLGTVFISDSHRGD